MFDKQADDVLLNFQRAYDEISLSLCAHVVGLTEDLYRVLDLQSLSALISNATVVQHPSTINDPDDGLVCLQRAYSNKGLGLRQ